MALMRAFDMHFTRLVEPVSQHGTCKSKKIAMSCRLCDNSSLTAQDINLHFETHEHSLHATVAPYRR